MLKSEMRVLGKQQNQGTMISRCLGNQWRVLFGSRSIAVGKNLHMPGRIYNPHHVAPAARLPLVTFASSSAATANQSTTAIDTTAPHPPKMSGHEIREAFLKFYQDRGHTRLPSASLVPEDPTVLLTIAGMLQFKPIFLGQQPRSHPRATTSQKCVRTNDIENVGVTKRHHTFFEMLGNFSFGDYFKEEACQMAWELSTKVFKLPAERVWVSVYEEDEEAFKIWRDVVGVPEERIRKMGAEDNFWASGPTGPCGPCSELYYDFHPERGNTPDVTLEDDTRFVEFYNLVFMESNRTADGDLQPLSAKNIDTGMGLERMAQILQGAANNYETDLVWPLLHKASTMAGIEYTTTDEKTRTALKVIGDHVRAVTYLISDGVTPSNVGRGYVLRRLIRRVILKGKLLGIQGEFTPTLAAVAVELSHACDPSVVTNAERIYTELSREEARFASTLEAGNKVLQQVMAKASAAKQPISGSDAFLLYDTFGFPLEVTLEVAAEAGVDVDQDGFQIEMEAQRKRSKEAFKAVDLTANGSLDSLSEVGATEFVGYTQLTGTGRVLALLRNGEAVDEVNQGDEVDVVLDCTPFYAEGGGQVGDIGLLSVVGGGISTTGGGVLQVTDTKKVGASGVVVHRGTVHTGQLTTNSEVASSVDETRRRRTRCNHTATHLLQSALKTVLGQDTSQQGSLVEGDRLRFDFNLPRPMKPEEVARVEDIVNGWIQEAHGVSSAVMPIADAKAAGATAMFGEKYGDVVRVIDVPGVSMELCGGTHVSNTAEIGAFKIVSESGIASGVRRVEAVAGPSAIEYLSKQDSVVRKLSSQLKARSEEIPDRVAALQEELKAAQKAAADLSAQLAAAKASSLADTAVTMGSNNDVKVVVSELSGVDGKALQEAASSLIKKLGDPAVVVLASASADNKAAFAVAMSPSVVKQSGLQAGKFVGEIAKICGGGGGGKPDLAQAGGKDASKLGEALEVANQKLVEAL